MKKILITLVLLVTIGCNDKGSTTMVLDNPPNLPKELEGLKIYSVSTGGGNRVKVALFNGNLNSITYPVNKNTMSTILINKQDDRTIEVSSILMENDSLIICKK